MSTTISPHVTNRQCDSACTEQGAFFSTLTSRELCVSNTSTIHFLRQDRSEFLHQELEPGAPYGGAIPDVSGIVYAHQGNLYWNSRVTGKVILSQNPSCAPAGIAGNKYLIFNDSGSYANAKDASGNTGLIFDENNVRLGIGLANSATPAETLDVVGNIKGSGSVRGASLTDGIATISSGAGSGFTTLEVTSGPAMSSTGINMRANTISQATSVAASQQVGVLNGPVLSNIGITTAKAIAGATTITASTSVAVTNGPSLTTTGISNAEAIAGATTITAGTSVTVTNGPSLTTTGISNAKSITGLKTVSLDPNDATNPNAIVVTNGATQSSGNLVSITGTANQIALSVPTGRTVLADANITLFDGTLSAGEGNIGYEKGSTNVPSPSGRAAVMSEFDVTATALNNHPSAFTSYFLLSPCALQFHTTNLYNQLANNPLTLAYAYNGLFLPAGVFSNTQSKSLYYYTPFSGYVVGMTAQFTNAPGGTGYKLRVDGCNCGTSNNSKNISVFDFNDTGGQAAAPEVLLQSASVGKETWKPAARFGGSNAATDRGNYTFNAGGSSYQGGSYDGLAVRGVPSGSGTALGAGTITVYVVYRMPIS